MKILECQQGSVQWMQARLGIPTASRFNALLTPKTLKPSAQAEGYLHELVAEWAIGEPAVDFGGGWTDRGTDLEPEARDYYAFSSGLEVRLAGFCTTDDGRVGGSPDALVGEDGGLEIKCPAAKTHVSYLLNPEKILAAYRHQVQGLLFVTGRAWWDLMSYNPAMPTLTIRCEPEPEYQSALVAALAAFLDDLEAAKAKIQEMRASKGMPNDLIRCPISGEFLLDEQPQPEGDRS